MILLLSSSDFDERKHKNSRRKANSGVGSNTSDVLENARIFALDLFEVNAQGVKAVVNVIFISVTS
jgi:hypothetical protein